MVVSVVEVMVRDHMKKLPADPLLSVETSTVAYHEKQTLPPEFHGNRCGKHGEK